MNTISRKVIGGWWLFSGLLTALVALVLTACDFNGPWSYYPDEREVYAGIYTYGYIGDGENPYVCFSKMYKLEEAAAENFAFYDSAYVTVESLDDAVPNERGDTIYYNKVVLDPQKLNPNCFAVDSSSPHVGFVGSVGASYRLRAFFKWDSAGHKVESEFSAVAKIPEGFTMKGVSAPQKDGSYKWIPYDSTKKEVEDLAADDDLNVEFLEYPDDMSLYKFVFDYNETVRGIMGTMDYDVQAGENAYTTMNHMLEGLKERDSTGYLGLSIHDPLESSQYIGFETNQYVAGINALDTIFFPNMTLSMGAVKFNFYAVDSAFVKYSLYVVNALEDPRVVPESNIENGMGVFFGMARVSMPMFVKGRAVLYWSIALSNCIDGPNGGDAWDSKSCRLYQDVYCSGMAEEYEGETDELYEMNEKAYTYYELRKYKVNKVNPFCYAPAVKAAMMLDTTSWSVFLPADISPKDKSEAYADGLKRYCVANNFKSNKIADCDAMKEKCMESLEKNSCKEYLWNWCADRNWDVEKYPQCGTALVSRYYLEEQSSSILQREVDAWCSRNKSDSQCKKK